jgi:hypothetical protein
LRTKLAENSTKIITSVEVTIEIGFANSPTNGEIDNVGQWDGLEGEGE